MGGGSTQELYPPSEQNVAPAGGVSASAVSAQLAKILTSRTVVWSDRQTHFLRYLVEHALRDDSDRLDECLLGVEVFNRRAPFDPQSDGIVRVEASRLRRKLEEYYGTEGQNDPVLIELPKRTYVPAFRNREVPTPTSAPAPRRLRYLRGRMAAGLAAMALLAAVVLLYRELPLARALVSGGTNRVERDPTLVSSSLPTLVVLPFAYLGPDPDQHYFSDGLTEELIEAFGQLEGLRVVSRTSSFHFKGTTEDIRKIGAQLGVGLALEGSVRRAGQRVRTYAQLVDTSDGLRLWSSVFERDAQDFFGVQRELAEAIAATLRVHITARERPHRHVPDPAAYALYLQGIYFAREGSEAGFRKAIQFFERAIETDRNYGEAYAAAAQCYTLLGINGAMAPAEGMPKAKVAASQALALDDNLAHAHVPLGMVKAVYDWDWDGAEQEFQRAFQLDPGDATIFEAHVTCVLVPRGRLDQALAEAQRAHALDPVSPRIHWMLGRIYDLRSQHHDALAEYREAFEFGLRSAAVQLSLGLVYQEDLRFQEAIAAFRDGKAAWSGGVAESFLGYTYARMGKRAEAQDLIRQLQELSEQRYVSASYPALIYAGLGDRNRAIEYLEQAYKQRSPSLSMINVEPRFVSLRSDPRFRALLRKIRLE